MVLNYHKAIPDAPAYYIVSMFLIKTQTRLSISLDTVLVYGQSLSIIILHTLYTSMRVCVYMSVCVWMLKLINGATQHHNVTVYCGQILYYKHIYTSLYTHVHNKMCVYVCMRVDFVVLFYVYHVVLFKLLHILIHKKDVIASNKNYIDEKFNIIIIIIITCIRDLRL